MEDIGKMFQTKVVGHEGKQMMKICTWPWVTYWRSGQCHRCFLKWNPLFFIAYSCRLCQDVFKTIDVSFASRSQDMKL